MACPSRYPAWRGCGRGFTLLELMISIAVLAIMIMAAIVSLLPARNQARLKAVQAEVATTIKMIQSNALQGKVTNGAVPAGYGFQFIGNQTYEIFSCDPCTGSADTQVAVFSLQDRGVTLNSPAFGSTRFYFDIPNGNCSLTEDLPMVLNISGSGITKTVRVKKSGAVLEE